MTGTPGRALCPAQGHLGSGLHNASHRYDYFITWIDYLKQMANLSSGLMDILQLMFIFWRSGAAKWSK